MVGPIMKEYISATSKSFVSNDNNGKMIEKNFIEIEGTFLLKIRDNAFYNNDGEDVFKHINSAASEWFTKECIGTISTWDDLVERFVLKFYNLCKHDEEEETEDEDDPDVIDNISEIFKIDDDLFKFDSPLCIPFEEFNHLLKIDPDLFTYNTQKIKTYEEYEQELNNKTQGLEEPWLKNKVSYQLYDHICEPYRFKNGKTKWPACNSDIDGFCNSGELPGMVRVGNMTYFQDHKWYDELADGKLKRETLALKAKIEGTWGEATPCVNTHEIAPFTRTEDFGRGPYANMKTKLTHDPYLGTNQIFGGNYEASNVVDTQENQGHEEHMDNATPEQSVCKIRRFEMMKYSFGDDEYITIK
ncbi:hypothetical protein Tco_0331933 [Tanacetum coccineum]